MCGSQEPVSVGRTPFTYHWEPQKDCSLRFQKPDYRDVTEDLQTEFDTTAIGNCGSPAYVFIPVDWYTDAYLRPRDMVIDAELPYTRDCTFSYRRLLRA